MRIQKQALARAMDFKVRSIEEFLGIRFEGKTDAEKRSFVEKHWEERVEVTDSMMEEAYKEKKGGV